MTTKISFKQFLNFYIKVMNLNLTFSVEVMTFKLESNEQMFIEVFNPTIK